MIANTYNSSRWELVFSINPNDLSTSMEAYNTDMADSKFKFNIHTSYNYKILRESEKKNLNGGGKGQLITCWKLEAQYSPKTSITFNNINFLNNITKQFFYNLRQPERAVDLPHFTRRRFHFKLVRHLSKHLLDLGIRVYCLLIISALSLDSVDMYGGKMVV